MGKWTVTLLSANGIADPQWRDRLGLALSWYGSFDCYDLAALALLSTGPAVSWLTPFLPAAACSPGKYHRWALLRKGTDWTVLIRPPRCPDILDLGLLRHPCCNGRRLPRRRHRISVLAVPPPAAALQRAFSRTWRYQPRDHYRQGYPSSHLHPIRTRLQRRGIPRIEDFPSWSPGSLL